MRMGDRKTPGVYVVEENAFPNGVVDVATGVPVFLGYTATGDATKAVRIGSMDDFQRLFGGTGGAPRMFGYVSGDNWHVVPVMERQSLLELSLRLYFANGGGNCYVISLGGLEMAKSPAHFVKGLEVSEREMEPSIVVAPDAVVLNYTDWKTVKLAMVAHCASLQSRIAILDVHRGWAAMNTASDPVNGASDGGEGALPGQVVAAGGSGFRAAMTGVAGLNYAAAYYPWLQASVVTAREIDANWLDAGTLGALGADVGAQGAGGSAVADMGKELATATAERRSAMHGELMAASPRYAAVMEAVRVAANLLPPSAAMAGIYARTDAVSGVYAAPANVGIVDGVPVVGIDESQQDDLNMPVSGLAVNALRVFPSLGPLVWGARTLDGNSQDWRYVNVRRTMIYLEQSIKVATQAYVFEPNSANTWLAVQSRIENFLTGFWKMGGLAGAKPEDAFSVDVGLGSTMTGQDILDGYMRVAVKVAVAHPAEFIVITLQQLMAKS